MESSQNEALDTPNSPQGTPGATPGRAQSQKGFPNSMFDGLGLILGGFWKDIVAEPSHQNLKKNRYSKFRTFN
jgi:hypothetical protein